MSYGPGMRLTWVALVLALRGGEAEADKRGVVFGRTELRYARAMLYQTPYGNVTLDLDLSARPMRCEQDPVAYVDRGTALAVSVHPGPSNGFFAGATPFAVDVYLYREGEQQHAEVELRGATLRLAPFKVKAKAAVSGRIEIPGHGGGDFTTRLCPIKNVKLPVPLPDPGAAVAATIDGKAWRPAKVLARRALVDGKPNVVQIWVVDAERTCASPTGPGSLSLQTAAAVSHPGTVQPSYATITPPSGDATYAAITSLAWMRLDLANGDVRGSFAARQDAAKGARWEASGRFTAELCPLD